MADRVNDLVGDTQCQLKEKCEDVVTCSVATDESASVTAVVRLSGFIRGVKSIRTSCLS